MKKSRYLLISFALTIWILYSCNSSGTKNYEASASNQETYSDSSLIDLEIECDSESICGAVFVDTNKRSPTKEANIPSIALIKCTEFFNRSKKGATVITIKNEGVNIAIVATNAPGSP